MGASGVVAESRPILVFDSGLGGLSVLSAIRTLLPGERYIYLADDAGFPYGARSDRDLADRAVAVIGEAIAAHDPAAVVIACNTASTLVLPPLRERFAVPFVGTVPAIKPAAAASRSGIIAVLATPGTIRRDYTRNLIEQFAGHCHVCLVGAPDLAALAERQLAGETVDMNAMAQEIEPCFVTHEGRRTDIVVLACTHYPFLVEAMSGIAPWPVTWLDPAPAIARQVVRVLDVASKVPAGRAGANPHCDRQNVVYFTSRQPPGPVRGRLLERFDLSVSTARPAV